MDDLEKVIEKTDGEKAAEVLGELVEITDSPNSLLAKAVMEYPDFHYDRESVREAIRSTHSSKVRDDNVNLASDYPLLDLADRGLYTELRRLVSKQQLLMGASLEITLTREPVLLPGDTDYSDAGDIETQLHIIGNRMSSIRKDLKSGNGLENPAVSVNINMDRQVASAVGRMKQIDAVIIDPEKEQ